MYGCILTVHANIGSSIQVFVHQLLVLHTQFQVYCSVTSVCVCVCVCVLSVYQFRLLGGGKLIPCLSHGGSRWHNEGVKNIIAALLQNINILVQQIGNVFHYRNHSLVSLQISR
jgi:hypothetical protein